jgi:hypothetical protein
MEFVGDKKMKCNCGSKNCSGLIGEAKKIDDERKTIDVKKRKSLPNTHNNKTSSMSSTSKMSLASKIYNFSSLFEDTDDPFIFMMDNL